MGLKNPKMRSDTTTAAKVLSQCNRDTVFCFEHPLPGVSFAPYIPTHDFLRETDTPEIRVAWRNQRASSVLVPNRFFADGNNLIGSHVVKIAATTSSVAQVSGVSHSAVEVVPVGGRAAVNIVCQPRFEKTDSQFTSSVSEEQNGKIVAKVSEKCPCC